MMRTVCLVLVMVLAACAGLSKLGPGRSTEARVGATLGRPGEKHPLAAELRSQLGLQYLAVVVLRQRLDEAVFARALEARNVLETQRVELFAFHRRFFDDKGDHLLTPFLMRAADDRALGHRGMAQQDFL